MNHRVFCILAVVTLFKFFPSIKFFQVLTNHVEFRWSHSPDCILVGRILQVSSCLIVLRRLLSAQSEIALLCVFLALDFPPFKPPIYQVFLGPIQLDDTLQVAFYQYLVPSVCCQDLILQSCAKHMGKRQRLGMVRTGGSRSGTKARTDAAT